MRQEHGQLMHVVASSRGGGAVHVRSLTIALADRGYSVTAAMPVDEGPVAAEELHRHGVTLVPLAGASASPLHRVRELARAFETRSPALVHAHGSRAGFLAYWALKWKRLRETQLVFSLHGFVTPFHRQPRRLLQSVMERRVGARASAVIACAEAERAALLEARIAPPSRVHVVHYGFDLLPFIRPAVGGRLQARAQLGFSTEERLVLTVCRLDRPRDFPTLLRAFRGLVETEPRTRLLIVGDGPGKSEIDALIRDLELADTVTQWGFRTDVASFYAAADVFVLTSWGWEGLPISVIEAQAAGVPVVVTDAGGSREALARDETGVLVPPCSPDALRTALQALISNPDQAASMGGRARQFALSRFSLAPMVEKMQRLYASLGLEP